MKKRKAGTLKSGRSGKKVKSRKQAIAIGLSEARAKGKKVPKKAAKKRKAEEAVGVSARHCELRSTKCAPEQAPRRESSSARSVASLPRLP